MLTPEDLLTIAHADLAARRARAAAAAARPPRTVRAGRWLPLRALGRALVAAGTRLEGRSPAPTTARASAPVGPAGHEPCDEVVVPRAA